MREKDSNRTINFFKKKSHFVKLGLKNKFVMILIFPVYIWFSIIAILLNILYAIYYL